MRKRAEIRAAIKPRYWHMGLCAVGAAGIFGFADFVYLGNAGALPGLKEIWWLVVLVPLVCGAVVTLCAGGTALWKRIIGAAVCGAVAGVLYPAGSSRLGHAQGVAVVEIAKYCFWRTFIFAGLSTIGAVITELKLDGRTGGQVHD